MADIIITNGRVFTGDTSVKFTEAVAIKGEFIIATGSSGEIARFNKKGHTRIIDAEGRLVMPGFNDAHLHFGPLDPDFVELRYVTDPAVITKKVQEQVSKSKKGQLIKGGHWEHEMFFNKQWPDKSMLDSVAPDNPVILSRADGHSILVNSYILKASGITAKTADPAGGEIQRDPVTGEPTGILKETATAMIKTGEIGVERTSAEEKEREHLGYIRALKEAAELGVTSIQNAGEADFQYYEKLLQDGELTSRIDIGMPLTADIETLNNYAKLRDKYNKEGNWIRFGYLKGFIDGTIGSGTALMFEPFNDDPSTSGLAMMTFEELQKQVTIADSMGFQVGIHAIGDKGNNWVLNAFEHAIAANGRRDSRHRDEHSQNLVPSDIKRFAQLGVIASMQPTHCISDKKFCEKRIGTERAAGAYAWKSLANAGAAIAFGTDYTVEPLNPMEGLYASVTRKDRMGEEGEGWFPGQKLTMEEAIRFYTLGPAYAQFMEDRKGLLKPGYLADIVITDKDLFTIPEQEIMKTKIDFTITGGRIVFER
ncbi:MAG TPA: amidohydrolase [Bacteroidales bacterium]|nr:amidohydrolase [Bacteroidales bacterium]